MTIVTLPLATLLLALSPVAATATKPLPPEDLNNVPADAEKSSTGVQWKRLNEGSGNDRASENDFVKFHYIVWTSEGRLLDDMTGAQAAIAPVNKMLPGLREMIETM